MTSTFARVAAGVPTGGQFATTTHREADVSLGVGAATEDGPWSVEALRAEAGDTAANRHLAAADGQLGAALAMAVQEQSRLERGLLPEGHVENPSGVLTTDGITIPADGTYVTAALDHGTPIKGVTVGIVGHREHINALVRTGDGRVHAVEPASLAETGDQSWAGDRSDRNGDELTVEQLADGTYTWKVGPPGQPPVFTGHDTTLVEARKQAEFISDGTAAARTRIATDNDARLSNQRHRDDAVLREMLRGADPDSIEPPF